MSTTKLPFDAIPLSDVELIENCVWRNISFFAKMGMQTTIVDGVVMYQCAFGWKKGNDVIYNALSFRYNDLQKLYDHLVKKYSIKNALPPFPPKKWFWNTSKATIYERIDAFDRILRMLNQFMDLNNDDELNAFFGIDIKDKNRSDVVQQWLLDE